MENMVPEPNTKYLYNYNKFRSTFAQSTAIIIGNMIMLQFGMTIAMSTVVNGKLMFKTSKSLNASSDIQLTDTESAWYGSLLLIFHPVGSLLSSYIQDKYGRKTCIVLVPIPEILGWLSLYFARSSVLLNISSSCLGVAMGLSEAPLLTYIGECIEPRIRSGLSSFTNLCAKIGLFLTYVLAIWFTWREIALIYTALPAIVFLMAIFIIPESPVWLMSKGKQKAATASLTWLRGSTSAKAVEFELKDMQLFIEEKHVNHTDFGKLRKKTFLISYICDAWDILADQNVLDAFIMFNIVFVFCTISAMLPAKPFLVPIMLEVGLPIGPDRALVIVGTMTITGSFLNMMTVKAIGKRRLLIISTLIAVTSQCIIGIYAMGYLNFLTSNRWLPFGLVCIVSFIAGYGITPIPWIMLGEIFPMKARGTVSGIAAALNSIFAFLLTFTYWYIVNICSLPITIIIHATIGAVGLPYIYYMLPETENKTLQQIQDGLTNSRNRATKV